MVISVPYPFAKVAYRLKRLHRQSGTATHLLTRVTK